MKTNEVYQDHGQAERPSRDELLSQARTVADRAYAPYSRFRVGAALRTVTGEVYTGVNMENRSYGLTICAERGAVQRAVADGHTRFSEIAVVCPDADQPTAPCGACRQVLSEFMDAEAQVHFAAADQENVVSTTIAGIYPYDSLHHLRGDRDT